MATGKSKTKWIVIAVVAIIALLGLCCVCTASFFLFQRSSKLSTVEDKYAKIKTSVDKVDKDISALETEAKKLESDSAKAGTLTDEMNAKIDAADTTANSLSAHTDSWNARDRTSYDGNAVAQANALVGEMNTLREQVNAKFTEFDATVVTANSMLDELGKIEDDFMSTKSDLDSTRTGFKNQFTQIDNLLNQTGLFSANFDDSIAKQEKLISEISTKGVPEKIDLAKEKIKTYSDKTQAYTDHVATQKAIVDDIIAKQARMTELTKQMDAVFP